MTITGTTPLGPRAFWEEEDYLSIQGATKLAKRIIAHWQMHGFLVNARVEVADLNFKVGGNRIYCVRSDLINGNPTKRAVAWDV